MTYGFAIIDAFTAIQEGKDPYRALASERFGKPVEEVTEQERFETKTRVMHAIYSNFQSHPTEVVLRRPAHLMGIVETELPRVVQV